MTFEKCSICKHSFTTKGRLYCKKALADKDDCGKYEIKDDCRNEMTDIEILQSLKAYTCKPEVIDKAISALRQKPCEDCVSRQDAVNACRNGWGYDDETIEHIVGNILGLPPVTPIQRMGKWIDTGQCEEWYRNVLECSLCGGEVMFDENYCPKCGAKMEVYDEDRD